VRRLDVGGDGVRERDHRHLHLAGGELDRDVAGERGEHHVAGDAVLVEELLLRRVEQRHVAQAGAVRELDDAQLAAGGRGGGRTRGGGRGAGGRGGGGRRAGGRRGGRGAGRGGGRGGAAAAGGEQ